MKVGSMKILDDKDLEFAEALRDVGVQRNVATLITYLANVDETSSRDIEMATGLRQPEVSIAMRLLREMNWIEERDLKGEGKGRPMRIYSLKTPIDEIVRHYELEKTQESEQMMESIQKLKELASS